MDRRSGLRAEALLLHHHRRRRRHYVLVPVLSPAPPLSLALHVLHAETAEERRKNYVRCTSLAKGNDGLDPWTSASAVYALPETLATEKPNT